MKRKLRSTVMKSIREGLAAVRIAEFLNEQLKGIGIKNGIPGALIFLEVGGQCTTSGVGKIYDDFKRTGKIINYTGYGQQATRFNEPNYEKAQFRFVNFDETFHKMPYDARTSEQ